MPPAGLVRYARKIFPRLPMLSFTTKLENSGRHSLKQRDEGGLKFKVAQPNLFALARTLARFLSAYHVAAQNPA